MKTLKTLLIVLAAATAAPLVHAQQTVDQRREADPKGQVFIENQAGSIHVTGWDKNEVAVTGSLGRRAEGLSLHGDGSQTRIEVEVHGNPMGVRSDIEVKVPKGSDVSIEGFQAEITVDQVLGEVRADTVNGSVSVSGDAREVEIETVNGNLEVKGGASRVRAESVNGGVVIEGASGEVEASTVNGRLHVRGGSFRRAALETVNGEVVFEGALAPRATLDAESVGGSIELRLGGDVDASFDVSTFSGDIDNRLSDQKPEKTSRWTPEKELRFTLGTGAAKVSVNTLSGGILLAKR